MNLLAKPATSACGGRSSTVDLTSRLKDTPSYVLRKLRKRLHDGIADMIEEKQNKVDAMRLGSMSVESRGLPWAPASTPHGIEHRLLDTAVTPRHAQEYAARLFNVHAQQLAKQASLRQG